MTFATFAMLWNLSSSKYFHYSKVKSLTHQAVSPHSLLPLALGTHQFHSVLHSFLWLHNILCIHNNLSIHSSVDWYLDCFYILAIVNTVINMSMPVLVGIPVFNYTGSGFGKSYGNYFLNFFLGTTKLFSSGCINLYFLQQFINISIFPHLQH